MIGWVPPGLAVAPPAGCCPESSDSVLGDRSGGGGEPGWRDAVQLRSADTRRPHLRLDKAATNQLGEHGAVVGAITATEIEWTQPADVGVELKKKFDLVFGQSPLGQLSTLRLQSVLR